MGGWKRRSDVCGVYWGGCGRGTAGGGIGCPGTEKWRAPTGTGRHSTGGGSCARARRDPSGECQLMAGRWDGLNARCAAAADERATIAAPTPASLTATSTPLTAMADAPERAAAAFKAAPAPAPADPRPKPRVFSSANIAQQFRQKAASSSSADPQHAASPSPPPPPPKHPSPAAAAASARSPRPADVRSAPSRAPGLRDSPPAAPAAPGAAAAAPAGSRLGLATARPRLATSTRAASRWATPSPSSSAAAPSPGAAHASNAGTAAPAAAAAPPAPWARPAAGPSAASSPAPAAPAPAGTGSSGSSRASSRRGPAALTPAAFPTAAEARAQAEAEAETHGHAHPGAHKSSPPHRSAAALHPHPPTAGNVLAHHALGSHTVHHLPPEPSGPAWDELDDEDITGPPVNFSLAKPPTQFATSPSLPTPHASDHLSTHARQASPRHPSNLRVGQKSVTDFDDEPLPRFPGAHHGLPFLGTHHARAHHEPPVDPKAQAQAQTAARGWGPLAQRYATLTGSHGPVQHKVDKPKPTAAPPAQPASPSRAPETRPPPPETSPVKSPARISAGVRASPETHRPPPWGGVKRSLQGRDPPPASSAPAASTQSLAVPAQAATTGEKISLHQICLAPQLTKIPAEPSRELASPPPQDPVSYSSSSRSELSGGPPAHSAIERARLRRAEEEKKREEEAARARARGAALAEKLEAQHRTKEDQAHTLSRNRIQGPVISPTGGLASNDTPKDATKRALPTNPSLPRRPASPSAPGATDEQARQLALLKAERDTLRKELEAAKSHLSTAPPSQSSSKPMLLKRPKAPSPGAETSPSQPTVSIPDSSFPPSSHLQVAGPRPSRPATETRSLAASATALHASNHIRAKAAPMRLPRPIVRPTSDYVSAMTLPDPRPPWSRFTVKLPTAKAPRGQLNAVQLARLTGKVTRAIERLPKRVSSLSDPWADAHAGLASSSYRGAQLNPPGAIPEDRWVFPRPPTVPPIRLARRYLARGLRSQVVQAPPLSGSVFVQGLDVASAPPDQEWVEHDLPSSPITVVRPGNGSGEFSSARIALPGEHTAKRQGLAVMPDPSEGFRPNVDLAVSGKGTDALTWRRTPVEMDAPQSEEAAALPLLPAPASPSSRLLPPRQGPSHWQSTSNEHNVKRPASVPRSPVSAIAPGHGRHGLSAQSQAPSHAYGHEQVAPSVCCLPSPGPSLTLDL